MPKKEFGAFDQPGRPDATQGGYGSDSAESKPSLGERLSDTVGEAGESLRGSAEKAGETVDDVIKEATERGKPVIDLINRYAREQPLAGMALAFVAGVAITSLFKR
jgi:ElaB/YqjD/DUF883 family membrane-anchored ribosome-binding protein